MLAVDTFNLLSSHNSGGAFPSHIRPQRQAALSGNASAHPPRNTSLARGSSPPKQQQQQHFLSVSASASRLANRAVEIPRDIRIDKWTRKIFSIISSGPTGGFVRYAISPRNELYVDRTGNRSTLDALTADLMPTDSCRYIAYKLRYMHDDMEKVRTLWFIWTPKESATKDMTPYLNGLAGALIGLNCPSSIPIIEATSTDDLATERIMSKVLGAKSSSSSSASDSTSTSSSSMTSNSARAEDAGGR